MPSIQIRKHAKTLDWPFNMIYVMLEEWEPGVAEKIEENSKVINDFNESVEYVLSTTLNDREQFVINCRFKELKTLEECGKLLNITNQAIQQIEAKALRKLRDSNNLRYFKYGIANITKSIENEYIELFNHNLKEMIEKYKVDKDGVPIYVRDLDLSVGTINSLHRGGIDTIAQCTTKTYEELSKIRRLGSKRLNELIIHLEKYGLHIKKENEVS